VPMVGPAQQHGSNASRPPPCTTEKNP
jgi:hypothetical protein